MIGKRILILGSSGAGKSTLSTQLGERLGMPVVYTDRLIWRPGWRMAERAKLTRDMARALSRKSWIMDGTLKQDYLRAALAADTVIFLDFPNWLCLFRVYKRIAFSYGRSRPEMSEGCPERWDPAFFHWIWRWPRYNRPVALNAVASARQRLVFRSPAELKAWLKSL